LAGIAGWRRSKAPGEETCLKTLEEDAMTKHQKRMQSIGKYNDPLLKAIANRYAEEMKNKPKYEAGIKKRWKKANAIIKAQCENGVGFLTDETIRCFLVEYNKRNFEHGLDSMPSSFNVMEAFLEHRPELAIFRLRDEKDHVFSVAEFFDFVTTPGEKNDLNDIVDYMEENVIYSYLAYDDLQDFTISSGQKDEYAIAGVSIIRHGTEVNMLLIAGKRADIAAETESLQRIEEMKALFGRQNLRPDSSLKIEAVQLRENTNFWKHLVLTRFDLGDATQDVRYVMPDCGNSFLIVTDDINIFLDKTGSVPSELEESLKQCFERIKDYNSLFDVCKSLLLLPIFFWTNSERIKDERHPTKLLGNLNKAGWITKKKLLGPKERIVNRQVAVLPKKAGSHPSLSSCGIESEIKIQKMGFWKMLPANKIGKDKEGNPIHSRTWVQQTLSWIEEDASATVVTAINKIDLDFKNAPNKGYIYVMRSASDRDNIFKIGLTRRTPEARSREVGRGTGVPTKYLVVQEWEVLDCIAAEQLVHSKLDMYRINKKREFFQAPYKVIRGVIEEILETINNSMSQ